MVHERGGTLDSVEAVITKGNNRPLDIQITERGGTLDSVEAVITKGNNRPLDIQITDWFSQFTLLEWFVIMIIILAIIGIYLYSRRHTKEVKGENITIR